MLGKRIVVPYRFREVYVYSCLGGEMECSWLNCSCFHWRGVRVNSISCLIRSGVCLSCTDLTVGKVLEFTRE